MGRMGFGGGSRPSARLSPRRYAPRLVLDPERPMAEQLLDRIRREIHQRREASEAAVLEYTRLEAALEALGGAVDAEPQASRPSKARTAAPRVRQRAHGK